MLPVRVLNSARTVPVQCPYSARTRRAGFEQCPYILLIEGKGYEKIVSFLIKSTGTVQNPHGEYGHRTGTVRALYGHCTCTVQNPHGEQNLILVRVSYSPQVYNPPPPVDTSPFGTRNL